MLFVILYVDPIVDIFIHDCTWTIDEIRPLLSYDMMDNWVRLGELNSPPSQTGVGHQLTVSTSTGCNQWLSLAEPTLKVTPIGRNRSLVARTNMCGWAISLWYTFYKFVLYSNTSWRYLLNSYIGYGLWIVKVPLFSISLNITSAHYFILELYINYFFSTPYISHRILKNKSSSLWLSTNVVVVIHSQHPTHVILTLLLLNGS